MIILIILSAAIASIQPSTASAIWKGKVIYQILTDRFDKTNSDVIPCAELDTYCGGTFEGARKRLDYVTNLGVDAIWMSPFVENTKNGYHGYWAKDLYDVNEKFGTKEELKALISDAHEKNLLVMADVVVNHMGQGMEDVPSLSPFNDTSFFHDCGCVDGDCCPKSCWVEDFHNPKQMLHCQLFGLPDLNQDLPVVADELKRWIVWMIKEYNIDGIRLDTVPYVKSTYWKEFTEAANVFSIGEVSTNDLNEMKTYVTSGAMNAVLQYPLYYSSVASFGRLESFQVVSDTIKHAQSIFGNNVDYLGLFSENHDNPRFLSIRDDVCTLFFGSPNIRFSSLTVMQLTRQNFILQSRYEHSKILFCLH